MINQNIRIIFGLILTFIFLLGCNNSNRLDKEEHVILNIGDYTVSQQQFNEQLEKLLHAPNGLNKEEANLLLLDNFISAGLLVESAKKLNYEQKKEFIEKLTYYRKQLKAKYIKSYRGKEKRDFFRVKNNLEKYYQNDIKIDYIRIPKKSKELSTFMVGALKAGSGRPKALLDNPEIEKWNNMGLSFYDNISIKSAVLTEKVLSKITQMEKDVTLVKEKSAYYVIRYLYGFKNTNLEIDEKQVLLNLKMAYALEDGDTMLDKYTLQKTIIHNDELLSKIDFSIPPLFEENSPDNKTIAVLFGHKINREEIIEKISKLPQNIQSLFRNKSTRTRALATLLLLNYYDVRMEGDTREYQSVLINGIKKNTPIDTAIFIEAWLNRKLIKHNTNSIPEALKSENNINRNYGTPNFENKNHIFSIQQEYNQWLYPEKLSGFNGLKFNYKLIENIEFPQKEINRTEILAYSENKWKLTVEGFIQALNNLIPENRIDISQGNNAIKMIKYLAKQQADINSDLKINTQLLESIDIVGNSFDSINYVIDEDAVIGELGGVKITVNDLRILVSNELPGLEKNRLINRASRKDEFNEIIMDKFWLYQDISDKVDEDPLYLNDLKQCENWLLTELFYKSEIQVIPVELDNERLNVQFRKAVKSINNERLESYLQKVSEENEIKVNKKILLNFGVDLNLSKYAGMIQDMN